MANEPAALGVHIRKGSQLRIPAGGLRLRIDDSGNLTGSVDLHVLQDVSPIWLELALAHLRDAEGARIRCLQYWGVQEKSEDLSAALDSECAASMQCAVACEIALEAFHACVKDRIGGGSKPPLTSTSKTKKRKRTGTAARIAETFRQGFKFGPESAKNIRTMIDDVVKFRSLAVHPDGAFAPPVRHPAFNVGMDSRFVTFRSENARALFEGTLGVLSQLVYRVKSNKKDLLAYCATAQLRFCKTLAAYEAEKGQLFERALDGKCPPYPAS